MGFIDYHGTKEDRYSEVVEYARAQQNEEWKKTQTERISKWLTELTGDGRLIRGNIQDLLKMVIVQYRALEEVYKKLSITDTKDARDADTLWRDFSTDLADRHIQSFHIRPDLKERHLQAFIDKIFRLKGAGTSSEYYSQLNDDPAYRKYFTEYFDPTWKGRHYFWILHNACYEGKLKELDDFYDAYKKLGVTLSIYLYLAFWPHDDGWMRQLESERNALEDIKKQSHKKPRKIEKATASSPVAEQPGREDNVGAEIDTDIVPPASEENVKNDNYPGQPENIEEEKASKIPEPVEVPKSKLNKKAFFEYVEKGNILNYIEACRLLFECDMPEDMEANYTELLNRMPVLQDAIEKFDEVYHADLDLFNEYYAPEALRLTATFLDYQAVSPSESVLSQTRENVMLATKKLLLVVNEKIDEIYKFVTIDTNAEARALEAMMSQDGYVDPNLKIK